MPAKAPWKQNNFRVNEQFSDDVKVGKYLVSSVWTQTLPLIKFRLVCLQLEVITNTLILEEFS